MFIVGTFIYNISVLFARWRQLTNTDIIDMDIAYAE